MKGTEKQIQWATDIKERALAMVDSEIISTQKTIEMYRSHDGGNTNYDSVNKELEMWQMARTAVEKLFTMFNDDAAAIINKRDNIDCNVYRMIKTATDIKTVKGIDAAYTAMCGMCGVTATQQGGE